MTLIFYIFSHAVVLFLIGASGIIPKQRFGQKISGEVFYPVYISVLALITFFAAYFGPNDFYAIIPLTAFAAGIYSCLKFFTQRKFRNKLFFEVRRCQILFYLSLLPLAISHIRVQSLNPFSDARTVFTKWGLPIDNEIPSILAKAISKGEYSSPLFATWLGSDRPPLQSAFLTLVTPFQKILTNVDLGYFSVGYILQVSWIFALYLLITRLGVNSSRAIWIVAFVSFTGFVTINSVYSWPKLMSATFLLLAISTVVNQEFVASRAQIMGILFGLGMLSHGGAAFAFPGMLVLFWIYHKTRLSFRIQQITIFFFSALATQIPWLLWQAFVDPPGNRLTKLHLAGIENITASSTISAVIQSYSEIGWRYTLDNKLENLTQIFMVPNLPLSPLFSFGDPAGSKATDFFSFFGSISWLIPGAALAIFSSMISSRTRLLHEINRGSHILRLTSFLKITILFWCLAMFGPGGTVNHQGTYIQNILSLGILGYFITILGLSTRLALLSIQSIAWLYIYCFSGLSYADHFSEVFLGTSLVALILIQLYQLEEAKLNRKIVDSD